MEYMNSRNSLTDSDGEKNERLIKIHVPTGITAPSMNKTAFWNMKVSKNKNEKMIYKHSHD